MTTARILSALLIAGLAAPAVCADDEKPKKPGEPAKPIIIQLDASKLPPELLKELLKLAKQANEPKAGALGLPIKPAKPEKPVAPEKPAVKPGTTEKPVVKPGAPEKPTEKPVKTIGLTDAIAIAEKTAQGTAIRAERKGDLFVVEVKTKKGDQLNIAIDASGKVVNDKGDKKNEDKGETGSKTKDKEENEDKKQKKQDDDDNDKRGKKPANNKEKKGD